MNHEPPFWNEIKKKKKNEKLEKETIAIFHPFFELYFLGQIIEPRPYWSFPI